MTFKKLSLDILKEVCILVTHGDKSSKLIINKI